MVILLASPSALGTIENYNSIINACKYAIVNRKLCTNGTLIATNGTFSSRNLRVFNGGIRASTNANTAISIGNNFTGLLRVSHSQCALVNNSVISATRCCNSITVQIQCNCFALWNDNLTVYIFQQCQSLIIRCFR